MAIPAHLNCAFSYQEMTPITDVASIITAFRAQVTAMTPAWTEPSTALFKTPVDSVGRWIDVLLTRIAATNLECRVRDSGGATVCTVRMQIASGSVTRIYAGEFYFHIEAVRGSPNSTEWLKGGILDLSPEAQNIHTHWAYGDGSRTAADALQNLHQPMCLYALDDAAYSRQPRIPVSATGSAGLTSMQPLYSPGGGGMFMAATVYAVPTGAPSGAGWGHVAGRMYQHLQCPGDASIGSEFKVPVDVNDRRWFKVLAPGTAYGFRLACRIS